MIEQVQTTDTFFFGLTLTEAAAFYSGIFGMLTGTIALLISWRSHIYTKSKDKIEFAAKIRFDSWYRQPRPDEIQQSDAFDVFQRNEDIKTYGFRIDLYNKGPGFVVHYCHIHSKPKLFWKKNICRNVHSHGNESEKVQAGNSYSMRVDPKPTDVFQRFARLEVHTRSDQSIFVRLKGWEKARNDFIEWQSTGIRS